MTVRAERPGAGSGSASALLARVLTLLAEPGRPACLFLSGGVGCGKSRAAAGLALELAHRGASVGGVICKRLLHGEQTVGYQACDLMTGEERPFARLVPPGSTVGRYFVADEALAFAKEAIHRGAREARVVFADEIGRWELAGGGLAPAVHVLLASRALPVLLVRDAFVEAAVETFAIGTFEVFAVEGIR